MRAAAALAALAALAAAQIDDFVLTDEENDDRRGGRVFAFQEDAASSPTPRASAKTALVRSGAPRRYYADGPMRPWEPSTIDDGWECSGGPCVINAEGEAKWNTDDFCEDTLEYHTHLDSNGVRNYDCQQAVDRYGRRADTSLTRIAAAPRLSRG